MERILVIGMSGDCGGIENYLLNMYEHLDHKKIQFDFLVKEPIGQEFQNRIEKLGGCIYETGLLKKNIIRTWRNIKEIYRKGGYKKVYVNLSYAPTLLYVIPGLKEKVGQVFIHSHASDDFRKMKHYLSRNLLLDILYRQTNVFLLGCSEEACKWMYGKKLSKKNVCYIIKNAIDPNRFMYNASIAESLRNKLQLRNAFVIGHVGRFSAEKNHEFIIEAFAELHKINSNTKLLLVGDGVLRPDIMEKAKVLGIEEAVVFTGNVTNPEQYYNVMDCFWLPSLYEGMPLVAIEAEANGLFCVFSEKIARTIDITKMNEFASIDRTDDFVKITEKILKGYARIIDWDKFKIAGYDINYESKKLENLIIMH